MMGSVIGGDNLIGVEDEEGTYLMTTQDGKREDSDGEATGNLNLSKTSDENMLTNRVGKGSSNT
jgi:hypothetical protein